MTHLLRRVAALACIVIPVTLAVPAGAASAPTLKSLTGHRLLNGSSSAMAVDGSCPSSGETPIEDSHQLFTMQIQKAPGLEYLGISVCWADSGGAEGGESVDTGTWELRGSSIPGGILRGTVRGSGSFARHVAWRFTLTIDSASGGYSGLYGNLAFWACGSDGNALLAGGLRLHAPKTFPASCDLG